MATEVPVRSEAINSHQNDYIKPGISGCWNGRTRRSSLGPFDPPRTATRNPVAARLLQAPLSANELARRDHWNRHERGNHANGFPAGEVFPQKYAGKDHG